MEVEEHSTDGSTVSSQVTQSPAGATASTAMRGLPSVDRVLSHPALLSAKAELPHDLLVLAIRQELDRLRNALSAGGTLDTSLEDIAQEAASLAHLIASPRLRPVINATGVVIHTNLGRAPLSKAAVEAIASLARYGNLEYDLEEGQRGSRYVHAVQVLRRVTGCEDALVVNNNAAALVLALAALGQGKEVVVSRGQLVEIGGGFRIPDIMRQSGARLVEVGTTNRTYLSDYEAAISGETSILLRVHASNFRLVGFTTSPAVEELAALAQRHNLLMVDDVGSGALLDTTRYGLSPEPQVQASLQAGADLVLFSGDKLLGGPQCGIIAGKGDAVARLRKHPLARALRVDKLTLAALEATLLHYLKGEVEREIPVWRMIAATPEQLRARATAWAEDLSGRGLNCHVEPGQSTVGGGSLPGDTLPTFLLALTPAPGGDTSSTRQAGEWAARLREATTPVVARVEKGSVLIDPRTVAEDEERVLLDALASTAR
ncbi:MAG: L-seryl-tRNA(Sec) selenium transferase [Chloroflexota bacterium]|nr:L-seryl-tRNA(Sec) selenium transferase [Chloroflexota bacterium]MDQ5865635.1 L-seryl-tRNA(Sec) selenium transferase [Chloroflexota bacterium]